MKLFTLFFVGLTLCSGKRADGSRGLRGVTQVRPRFELLKELEEQIGKEYREATERKLHEYEKDLQGTFTALPKNERGAIEAPSVRYTLHRLFNQRYGWQVKGLENSGGAWDAASPIRAMDDHVLPKVRQLFEEQLVSYGLDLHELSVLAATMDNMFHKDVERGIDMILQASGSNRNVSVDREGAQDIFISYIVSMIVERNVTSLTAADLEQHKIGFETQFTRHQEATRLLNDIVMELGAQSFDFDLIVSVINEFNRRLAGTEETDCKVMKKHLLKLEQHPGNGRVRLDDFHGVDSSEFGQFDEDINFLREHGLLDESNPNDLTVIIPNYMHSPSNCVSPSDYYNICCLDECEALMDHIEVEVAAPVVSPERIASAVISLEVGRDYNRSGGDLTPILKHLLDAIADHHGGQVPIHGRLFAQWMHQAFPRECAHPREVGEHGHLAADLDRYTDEMRKYQERLERLRNMTNHTSQTDHTPIGSWSWQEQVVDQKSHQKYVSKAPNTTDDMTGIVFDVVACAAALGLSSFLIRYMKAKGFFMKPRRHKDLKLL